MHLQEERYWALRTSVSHPEKPNVQPRGFGMRWRFPLEPTLSAAQASIATISGSESGIASRPEGGSGAESSSPERSGSPSDVAIEIPSPEGVPKDTSGILERVQPVPSAAPQAAKCQWKEEPSKRPLGSEAKSRIWAAPAASFYSRCDKRQLDAIITCQCALARFVTLEVDWSL